MLVGLLGNRRLAQDAAGVLIEQRDQLQRTAMIGHRAAQRLAVQGRRLQLGRRHADDLDHPRAQRLFQAVGRQGHQQVAEGIGAGGPAVKPQEPPDFAGLRSNPLGDGRIASRPAQHGTHGRGQHSR